MTVGDQSLSVQRTYGAAEVVTSDVVGESGGVQWPRRERRGGFGNLQRRIGQTADGVEIEAVIIVLLPLHHHDKDQLLYRVDREKGAPASLPVEAADRAWDETEIRVGADGEAEPPTRPIGRTGFVSREVDIGRH